MEAYRDQYATLFNNGKNVVVIGVSVDADTTLAAWLKEQDFPVLFLSDADGKIGSAYNAYDAQRKLDNRSLFVIDPTGKVSYVARPFNQMAQPAYDALGEAVRKASGATASGSGR